jgi:hypothetical protein
MIRDFFQMNRNSILVRAPADVADQLGLEGDVAQAPSLMILDS